MKRINMFLCAVAILLMGCGNGGSDSRTEKNNAVSSCEKASGVDKNSQSVPAGYVDLGLSVYWKNSNESNPSDDYGFYTYDAAMKKFGSSLPTKAQWEELIDRCTWTWTGNGYKVAGPSGNSIFLPAAGGRFCHGIVGGRQLLVVRVRMVPRLRFVESGRVLRRPLPRLIRAPRPK